MLIKELLELNEAAKAAKAKPTFVKYDDYSKWDAVGVDLDETEIDGKLVVVQYDGGGNVIGLWYNRAKVGSISKDFAKLRPASAKDPVAYSEADVHWPYDN